MLAAGLAALGWLAWGLLAADERVVYDRVSGGLLLRLSGIERGMPRSELLWPGDPGEAAPNSLREVEYRYRTSLLRLDPYWVLQVEIEALNRDYGDESVAVYLRQTESGRFDLSSYSFGSNRAIGSTRWGHDVTTTELTVADVWLPVEDPEGVLPVLRSIDERDWRGAGAQLEVLLEASPDDPFLLCLALDVTLLGAGDEVFSTPDFVDQLRAFETRLAASDRPFAEQALAHYRDIAAEVRAVREGRAINTSRDLYFGQTYFSVDALTSAALSVAPGQTMAELPNPFLLSWRTMEVKPVQFATFRGNLNLVEIEVHRRLFAGDPRGATELALGLIRMGQAMRSSGAFGVSHYMGVMAEALGISMIGRALLEGPPNPALMEELWPELMASTLRSRQIANAFMAPRPRKEPYFPFSTDSAPYLYQRQLEVLADISLLVTAIAARHAMATGTLPEGPSCFPAPLLREPLPDPSTRFLEPLQVLAGGPGEFRVSLRQPEVIANPNRYPTTSDFDKKFARLVLLESRYALPAEGEALPADYEALRARFLEKGLPPDAFMTPENLSFLLVDSDPPTILSIGPDTWVPDAFARQNTHDAYARAPDFRTSGTLIPLDCTPASTDLRATVWPQEEQGIALESECFFPQTPFNISAITYNGMDIVVWQGDAATTPSFEAAPAP